MPKQTAAVIVGRQIGVIRLNQFIRLLSDKTTAESIVRRIKFELGVKGSREGALTYAREIMASVENW